MCYNYHDLQFSVRVADHFKEVNNMPFINVITNCNVSDEEKTALKTAFGKDITAVPGKSESWLMVGIQPGYSLYFQGSSEPAAMLDVSIYGKADSSSLDSLTEKLTKTVSSVLPITPARIYVKYSQTPDWGWNGSNF